MDQVELVSGNEDAGMTQEQHERAFLLQQQQLARTRIKQQKFNLTYIGYLLIFTIFAVLQIIGVVIYTQGFLLSRQVLPDISECKESGVDYCMRPAHFKKSIILVIDALRFDFVIPVKDSEKKYHNNFPILHLLAQESTENAVLLKFISDPPTTTLQRLKGLTTGTLPTFIDAGSNFNGDEIYEDNLLLQMHKFNKSIAFMGDDTWTAMFNKYINPQMSFPYDSLNVWDFETVDNGVLEHLYPLITKNNSFKWDIIVGHFLGVDHVGHRYGPDHHTMQEKLNQMNDVVKDVVERLDDETLLIVMGDHGMDANGNHGGDSIGELESSLFMYSKNKQFHVNKKPLEAYDVAKEGKYYRKVNQIDLVPTISLLMGLPIPHNNLGFPIDEMFSTEKDLAEASYKTVNQILKFWKKSGMTYDTTTFGSFEDLLKLYNSLNKSQSYYEEFIDSSKNFQSKTLEQCKSMWATFDLPSISIGIAIILFSFLFLLIYSRLIPSVRLLIMSFELVGSVIAMVLIGLVSGFSVYVVLRPAIFTLKKCLCLGTTVGIIIGLWSPMIDKFSLMWFWYQLKDFSWYSFNIWSFLAVVFILLHTFMFASNSFVVWEEKGVQFFINTFGICCLFYCIANPALRRSARILGILHSGTFLLLSRITSMIHVCREEQGPSCHSSFNTTWWSIILLYAMSLLLPSFICAFYSLTDSYHAAGTAWIGIGLRYTLLSNAIYWTLEFMENNEVIELRLKPFKPILDAFKIGLANCILLFALVFANYSWSKGPLCIFLKRGNTPPLKETTEVENTEELSLASRISGYNNIYGSCYFLFILNCSMAIMLVTKPLGAISLGMLLVQVMSLLELYDIIGLRKHLIAPIMLGLLGFEHFFSSGHQATIPSIQWDVGFITTQSIIFPFTHLNIFMNTFGSFIITCLSVPLITLWRTPPSNKPISTFSHVVTDSSTLLMYQTLLTLSSLIFTAHFRRHLMVWKIFAPRFMMSGLLLLVVNISLLVLGLGFGTGKVMFKISRVFGK